MSEKTIKSVRRVFEIFELFKNLRRPLSAKEIALELDYPLASAHAIIKSMHELGYVDFDAPKWSYVPSRQFSLLSDWMAEFIEHETQLIECMEQLNRDTGETINLSRLTGDYVKIIHGLECRQPVGVSVKEGTMMPATQSLTGMAALATLDDSEFATFFNRAEKIGSDQASKANRKFIDAVKRELTNRGTVTRSDVFIKGIGAICVPVQTHFYKETMVIGVVGPSDRISRNKDRHRRTLKKLLSAFEIACHFKIKNPRNSR